MVLRTKNTPISQWIIISFLILALSACSPQSQASRDCEQVKLTYAGDTAKLYHPAWDSELSWKNSEPTYFPNLNPQEQIVCDPGSGLIFVFDFKVNVKCISVAEKKVIYRSELGYFTYAETGFKLHEVEGFLVLESSLRLEIYDKTLKMVKNPFVDFMNSVHLTLHEIKGIDRYLEGDTLYTIIHREEEAWWTNGIYYEDIEPLSWKGKYIVKYEGDK